MVGEDLVYSLFATPLIVFGALSGLRKWCQRRLTARSCWRRHIQYTSRLVFAFFDSIIGGVFLSITCGSGPSQLVNISEIYREAQIFPSLLIATDVLDTGIQ